MNAANSSPGREPTSLPQLRRSVNGTRTCYDVAVFGDGPSSCVFAIGLARRGKAVLIVPPATRPSSKPWGETLAPRGEFLLKRLGLASACLAGQHPTNIFLSCWQRPDPEQQNLDFDPHGRMWHLHRTDFDRALHASALQSGVEILNRVCKPAPRILKLGNRWEVQFASTGVEQTLNVGYLVDATGRSSAVSHLMGSKRVFRDRLAAVSCVVDRPDTILPLLIEPVSKGWWYSLGIPRGKLLLVLMTDPKLVKLSPLARRSLWAAMLNEAPHTRKRLGTIEGPLAVAIAESSRLDQMSGDGWLAIGDAAMSFDPLSSHGLTGAIEQAIEGAERISVEGTESVSEFDVTRKALFANYREQRRALYQSAERFLEDPFWQNRLHN